MEIEFLFSIVPLIIQACYGIYISKESIYFFFLPESIDSCKKKFD